MRSVLQGPTVAALASLLASASATGLGLCKNAAGAFDPDSLTPGCCNPWIAKRDLGAVPLPSLLGRTEDECLTATCCEKKKIVYPLDKTGADIQCGSKYDAGSGDGDTSKGIQYTFGPCSGDASKTCLGITVKPVKSGGCVPLSDSISVFIDDGSVAPTTNSGNWNFGNADDLPAAYCQKKTGESGCKYWSCEFEQSLWYSKIKSPGADGICGNTISVGVHFGTTSDTCTQGNTGLPYGNSWFQYDKITVNCKEVCDDTSLCCCPCDLTKQCCPGDTYCGGGGKAPNHLCPGQCCPGETRCDSPFCINNPEPNCCPDKENYCGTDGKTKNTECPGQCCPGETRCDSPFCTNNPEPNCCPDKENYCGTGGKTKNTECPKECCPGDNRCNNDACTGPEPACCPNKENYCGTDGKTKNTECPKECCLGDNRCNNDACTGPEPACCPTKENYCGTDDKILNKQCEPECCGGTCCEDDLCCHTPDEKDYCPQPQCQYGTGWGWQKPATDDTAHFVNKLKLCPANRWGEWFDIANLPFTGDLVVGRGGNDVNKGDIVGEVSLKEDKPTTVKACFDLSKTTAHIASVHVEVSCSHFDSSAYAATKKKSFNICAPGQWLYKFPPSGGCLDWAASQHDICITNIPKCPAGSHYYAIFHAAVTKNADGSCTPSTSCWTDS